MEQLTFKTIVEANPEKVWGILWSDETYNQWTAVFAEGSKAETDWKKGSRIIFHDGKGNGMISMITESRPFECMAFQHLDEFTAEKPADGQPKEWTGAREIYRLVKVNDQTELIVEMDVLEKLRDYFLEKWPAALEQVKILSENRIGSNKKRPE